MSIQRLALQTDLVALAVDGAQIVAVAVLIGLRLEDGGVAGVGRGFRAEVMSDAGIGRDLTLVIQRIGLGLEAGCGLVLFVVADAGVFRRPFRSENYETE